MQDQSQSFELQKPFIQTVAQQGFLVALQSCGGTAAAIQLSPDGRRKATLCVDGRFPVPDMPLPTVYQAGSGDLKDRRRLLQIIADNQIEVVTAHQKCGAGGIFCQRNGLTGDTDQHNADYLRGVAEEAGIDFQFLDLPAASPSTFHPEMGVLIDGTGAADLSKLEGAPDLYKVTLNPTLTPAEIAADVELCWTISKDNKHGLGNYFDQQVPFSVIGFVPLNQQPQLNQVRHILQPFLDNNADKVRRFEAVI